MFLTNTEHSIEEFLKALNFVAPQGTNITYFVTPFADSNFTDLAGQAGYAVESNLQQEPGLTDTLTYTKKPMRSTHSSSPEHVNPVFQPGPMPKNAAKPELLTQTIMTQGGEVESPEKLNRIAQIVESTNRYVEIQLKKDFGPFKEHTLFHAVRI